jgi:hypothetical protein
MAIAGAIAGAAGSILGGARDAEAAAQAQYNNYLLDEGRRKAATKALDGYGYTPYESKYDSFFDQYIDQYLDGGLTDAQEQQLEKASKVGASQVNTVMANRGGTIGGHLAMTQKLADDLAAQRLALSDENTQRGLSLASSRDQLNLQQWLKQQEAAMRYQELMAQYSPSEADVEAPKKRSTIQTLLDPGGFINF